MQVKFWISADEDGGKDGNNHFAVDSDGRRPEIREAGDEEEVGT